MPRTAALLGPDIASSAVRRTGAVLAVGAAALSAWACWLGSSLPPSALRQSWSAAWTGLGSWQLTWVMVDSLEVLGLLVTGVALRRDHWVSASCPRRPCWAAWCGGEPGRCGPRWCPDMAARHGEAPRTLTPRGLYRNQG